MTAALKSLARRFKQELAVYRRVLKDSRTPVIAKVLLEKQPTKKFVQPEEVAALAVFLCRAEAQNINGANYTIDGGWTAQ